MGEAFLSLITADCYDPTYLLEKGFSWMLEQCEPDPDLIKYAITHHCKHLVTEGDFHDLCHNDMGRYFVNFLIETFPQYDPYKFGELEI